MGGIDHSEHKDELSSWQAAIRSAIPGAAAAGLLEQRPEFADTDDEWEMHRQADALLDSLIARQGLMSHLAARQQADLDRLARRYPGLREHLATEVGLALGVAESTAGKYLDDAGSIRRLPVTFAALDAGQITPFKATVIRLHTEHVSEEVARKVEQRVVPAAGRQTMPELREACTRAVLRCDPAGAEDRHEKAKAGRGMSRRHLPEGMALLFLESAAQDIAVIYEACTALGLAARVKGDKRTADQRRMDALTDVCRDILDSGRWTPHQPVNVPPTADAENRCTGASSADRRAGESVAWAGARAGAGGCGQKPMGRATGVVTDPEPAAAAEPADGPGACDTAATSSTADAGASGPGEAGEPVHTPDLPDTAATADAIVPAAATDTAATANATGAAADPADTGVAAEPAQAGAAICPRPVILPERGSRRPHILVTVPAATLAGGNQPGYLAGHGPITAGQARTIAADGDLTRLICDPTTGVLLDYGRTRYRPPDLLRDFVHTRDRTCVTPGCRAPAARTDIDHVTSYKPGQNLGGATDVDNLASLCQHHHRAKDGGGSRLRHHPRTGNWTWTTALGRTYIRPAIKLWEPADPGEERALRKRSTPPGPKSPPSDAGCLLPDGAAPAVPRDKTPPPF